MDYPYIRAWGKMMGSDKEYIEDEVARARREDAPPTAIYSDYDSNGRTGRWRTYEDITREDTKIIMSQILKEMGVL